MAAHGTARATGDLDIWVDPSAANAECVLRALKEFGAPLGESRISLSDLTTEGSVLQMGVPPGRIDLLTALTGLAFENAWNRKVSIQVADMTIPTLSREDLILNKRQTGRSKDLADIDALKRRPPGKSQGENPEGK